MKEQMLEQIPMWKCQPEGLIINDRFTYQEVHVLLAHMLSWLLSDAPIELPLPKCGPRKDVMEGTATLHVPVLDQMGLDSGLGDWPIRNKAQRLVHLRMYLEDCQARQGERLDEVAQGESFDGSRTG